MATLHREFDACGECRLEVGGPQKYKVLTEAEIHEVLAGFESRNTLATVTQWLEANQPDVFKRGLQDAINSATTENPAV